MRHLSACLLVVAVLGMTSGCSLIDRLFLINADGPYANHYGGCPAGCEDWWANTERQDGLLVCGKPLDGDVAQPNTDTTGDFVFPVGSPTFVRDFLQGYVGKVQKLLGAAC